MNLNKNIPAPKTYATQIYILDNYEKIGSMVENFTNLAKVKCWGYVEKKCGHISSVQRHRTHRSSTVTCGTPRAEQLIHV